MQQQQKYESLVMTMLDGGLCFFKEEKVGSANLPPDRTHFSEIDQDMYL